MLSLINIGLLTYKDERFGVDESFEDFLKHNYDSSMKQFLHDRKQLVQAQRIQVLVAGRLLQPKIHCLKQIMPLQIQGVNVIPIALRRGPLQKFKLPFRGVINNYHELDIDFNFAQTSASIIGSQVKQSASASPVEFFLQPNQIKITCQAQTFLNITAKFKNSY